MRTALLLWFALAPGFAATDVRVDFTLNTSDPYGAPVQQQRYYYVYRPGSLPKTAPVPAVLVLEATPAAGPAGFFHRMAEQAGFVVVSCSFSGNSSGTPGTGWNADNPHVSGFEDFDYFSEVIRRVALAENANDFFMTGISKAGHMTLAYACERPSMLRAAGPLDEFMGLTLNLPTAPVPMIVFQGTMDTNVPYTMVKDTVDSWRAVNGLWNATPITTYESSPLIPGRVSQATWTGGSADLAFVTIIGGTHTYPTPTVQTGYDYTAAVWAFFSRYLTAAQDAPKIVSPPSDNIQPGGQPASFHVTAAGAAPISYQWQRDGADIPGATSEWLTLSPVTLDDDGATFQAVARNDFGSATSAAAKLTVTAAPAGLAIATQPADQSVSAGEAVEFTVAATGDPPLRYQWRKNGVEIKGATAATYTIPAAISPDCGASFTVMVTNAAGSVTSSRATLTVTPAAGAPIMLVNPARARVLPGQAASFSVTAWSETPMTYQWQKGTFTGPMADIPGATGAVYTTPPPTLADHLTLLRCVVSNASGNVTSASEMLFVTAAPTPPVKINSEIAASAQVGAPFQYTIISSGGTDPITYAASPLPDGLSLDPASGTISGTPSATGDTRIVMEAANKAGKTSAILTLSVSAAAPVIPIEAWRRAHFGASSTDPSIAGDDADPDGDGYTNLEEYNGGSDPLDPASVPAAPGTAGVSSRNRLH